jgi:hypothetical protein
MVGSSLLRQAVPESALVVAIDRPGKVQRRVWFSTGDAGLLEEPRSVPSLRPDHAARHGFEQIASFSPRVA